MNRHHAPIQPFQGPHALPFRVHFIRIFRIIHLCVVRIDQFRIHFIRTGTYRQAATFQGCAVDVGQPVRCRGHNTDPVTTGDQIKLYRRGNPGGPGAAGRKVQVADDRCTVHHHIHRPIRRRTRMNKRGCHGLRNG